MNHNRCFPIQWAQSVMGVLLLSILVASGACATAGVRGSSVLMEYQGSNDEEARDRLARVLKDDPHVSGVGASGKRAIGFEFEKAKFVIIVDTSSSRNEADVLLVCKIYRPKEEYRFSERMNKLVRDINNDSWIVANIDNDGDFWLCASYAYDDAVFAEEFFKFLRRFNSQSFALLQKYKAEQVLQ